MRLGNRTESGEIYSLEKRSLSAASSLRRGPENLLNSKRTYVTYVYVCIIIRVCVCVCVCVEFKASEG
jgi:hypothetical protein